MSLIAAYKRFTALLNGWAEVTFPDFRAKVFPLKGRPPSECNTEYIRELIGEGAGPALADLLGANRITEAMMVTAPLLPKVSREDVEVVIRGTLRDCQRRGWKSWQYEALLASLDVPSARHKERRADEVRFEMARAPSAAQLAAEDAAGSEFEDLYRTNALVRRRTQQMFREAAAKAPYEANPDAPVE